MPYRLGDLYFCLRSCLASAGVVLLCASLWLSSAAQAQDLVLGHIASVSGKGIRELQPMADYVAAELAEQGVTAGVVKLFPDEDSLLAAVKSGQVHWVTETGLVAARLIHEANAQVIARKWKNGQREYQSYIFTRRDSGISNLSDLRGRVIAFEHEDSFSSYYLPRHVLEQAGLPLYEMANLHVKPQIGQVNYVFSRTERNNVLWVDKGLVAAGVLNSGDWTNPKRVPPSVRERLQVISKSDAFPRAFELAGPGLSASAVAQLQAVLLNLTQTQHADLLRSYENTTRFEVSTDADREQLKAFYLESRTW